jgi:hypothetical protein
LTSELVLEQPEIGSTDPIIPINNNCMDVKMPLEMPVGRGDYEEDGDQSDERDAIPTASQQQWPVTELQRFDLGTSDVDGYGDEDGDNADADADKEEEASQADRGLT